MQTQNYFSYTKHIHTQAHTSIDMITLELKIFQLNNCSVFFAGTTKQSAKGVTKDARKKLNHYLYKQSILSGETVRRINTRIASSKLQLQTIVVNKKSLSGYDDNRFILSDHILTHPFGHKSLREEMFFKMIEQDPDWRYDSDYEIETETAHTPPVTHNIEADTHAQTQALPTQDSTNEIIARMNLMKMW